MADYSKRPEVTVETMGKVHNPTGEGIPVSSSRVQNLTAKLKNNTNHTKNGTHDSHETKVKEEGSARRNIARKKNDGVAAGGHYDSRNKKQGGHGKGKWSEALDDYDTPPVMVLNEKDPLYDELESERYILSSEGDGNGKAQPNGFDPVAARQVYGPMLTLPEFKHQVSEIIREYFDSSDADEVRRSIGELRCKSFHSEVVKKAISLSFDEGPRERELVSRLLTSLHPSLLGDEDMEVGFENLLDSLDDLTIDIPDAKAMAGCFLARAVVDEVLAPIFLSNLNNRRMGDEVVEKAVSLLSHEHCAARLEKVWGPGDGRPVPELKGVMDQLLKEYLLSRELDEAARCVREMNAPNFHHELVKRGTVIAMEEDGLKHAEGEEPSSLDAMAAMFAFLVQNAIVSEHQVLKGLTRLHQILPDIKLDIPGAPAMLSEFEVMVRDTGCLPPKESE